MTVPVPTFGQEAYAVLRGRFGGEEFGSPYLGWFLSGPMAKKTLHVLEKAGWIRRIGKGRYVCASPDEVFRSMIDFRVPGILKLAARPYAFAGASAVEVWTDYSYLQRSWEHSPYFVKVVRRDLPYWMALFAAAKVKHFVGAPETSLGEFVVLQPVDRLAAQEHNGQPVDSLAEAVRFCERHLDAFEYPLAYMKAKLRAKTHVRLDSRTMAEAIQA